MTSLLEWTGMLFLCLSLAHSAPSPQQESHVDARNDLCVHQEDSGVSIQQWPSGIIPYEMSESLTADAKVQLMQSMHHVGRIYSCAFFVPRNEQQDYVYFEPGERCCSITRRAEDGRQRVYVHDACVRNHSVYDVVWSLIGLPKNSSADARQSNSVQGRETVSHVTTEPTCSEICGGCIELNPSNSTPGLAYSPQYPHNYPANVDCVWKLISPPGYAIRVEFLEFDLEADQNCEYDFVNTFQLDAKGEILRREQWCGPQTPPLFRTEVQTQTVVIRFHSDERVVRRGFLFSYELEARNNMNNCNVNNGGCDHICVHDDTGLKKRCACREGYSLTADGQSCADINECSRKRGGCQQRCTNTEGSFQCYCRAGYSLNSDQKTCSSCGGYYNSTSGSIRSPGYPAPYPSYQNCLWTIEPRNNHYLKIKITNLDIAPSAKCTDSFLKLQHGRFRHHRKLCGYYSSIEYVIDVGKSTYARFCTKINGSHSSGFMLSYVQVPIEEVTPDDLKYVHVDGNPVPYTKRVWL